MNKMIFKSIELPDFDRNVSRYVTEENGWRKMGYEVISRCNPRTGMIWYEVFEKAFIKSRSQKI